MYVSVCVQVAGVFQNEVVSLMIPAFERRAEEVYGAATAPSSPPPPSPAPSATQEDQFKRPVPLKHNGWSLW